MYVCVDVRVCVYMRMLRVRAYVYGCVCVCVKPNNELILIIATDLIRYV